MSTNQRKTFLRNENRRLPHDLTSELRKRLDGLPSNRRTDYLRSVVFSKFVSDETDPASLRRNRAIFKWLLTERNNKATNERLMAKISEEYQILPRTPWSSFRRKLNDVIIDIIGEVPPDECLEGAFSGGATTSRTRLQSHPAMKYLGIADATPGALHFVQSLFEDRPLWRQYRSTLESRVREVPGNVLFTVPKTTEIDRCCCKEPDLNMYIQKGFGNYIRKRLRTVGVDLNDQTRNQNLARSGSITGNLATLDLSSASDSISKELVFQALPIHWYVALDSVRSPVTQIDGELHVNEMFSSMGNGYTFELESLLFYAIARTTAYFRGISGVISVYGDDIICPTELAEDLVFVLSFLGFSVNSEKSFWSGDFRESCGGHYIDGLDVTPFYVRQPVTRLLDLIHLANSIRQWANDLGPFVILDPEVEDLWWHFANMVPRQFWGGHDTSDKSRLVSAWRPKRCFRLLPNRKVKKLDEGGYLHWHDSKDDCTRPSETKFSERVVEYNTYRIAPVPEYSCSKPDHVFLTEIA